MLKKFIFSFVIFASLIGVCNVACAACSYCSAGNHLSCKNEKYSSTNDQAGNPGHLIYCCCGSLKATSGSYTAFKVHTYNISRATCTKAKKCTKCGYVAQSALGHSYSKTCSKAHCSSKVCSVCGNHKKSSCGGGHSYTNCSHCKKKYCKKCESHTPKVTCPCNNDLKCSDPHCGGATWCSYCGKHTHTPCNTNAVCPEAHCSQSVCSVCGGNHQGTCGGGHKYEWVVDEETKNHVSRCTVTSDCDATSGEHSPAWGSADANHTSTCQKCSLEYTHEAIWSESRRNSTEPHPCVWSGGCSATHEPKWGEYHKTSGNDGDTSGAPHTRECEVCGIEEIYHNYTTEAWKWNTLETHIRECEVEGCGLKQTDSHNFSAVAKKDVDDINHTELEKHWRICKKCDENHKEADELHEDNGKGICKKCGQILWKVINSETHDNITDQVKDEESANNAFREATVEEAIKIVEIKDGEIHYIQTVEKENGETVNAENNIIIITENGEYKFTTAGGGIGSFIIDNISRDILIDKILDPTTSTTGEVEITLRTSKTEEKYNKQIYIKEISKSQYETLGNEDDIISWNDIYEKGSNPFIYLEESGDKPKVSENVTKYYIAADSAGNRKKIKVVVDNIIKGQATVAISNDVFVKGYIFTEILVNPDESWTLPEVISNNIKIKAYEVGNKTGNYIKNDGIKFIKVMDMQRKDVIKTNGVYIPGEYYIQVAIGGEVFNSPGTYILDLEKVEVNLEDGSKDALSGKNRIIVEVKDLNNLT